MTTRREKIAIAREYGVQHAGAAARAARIAKIPLAVAYALIEKESMGRNVYGNDSGGVLSGFKNEVNRDNFEAFLHEVKRGGTSNGVGPCQITYPTFFDRMLEQGLKPWAPRDNMTFGFRLLKLHYANRPDWGYAGMRYNGSGPAAVEYGKDFATKVNEWKKRLN